MRTYLATWMNVFFLVEARREVVTLQSLCVARATMSDGHG